MMDDGQTKYCDEAILVQYGPRAQRLSKYKNTATTTKCHSIKKQKHTSVIPWYKSAKLNCPLGWLNIETRPIPGFTLLLSRVPLHFERLRCRVA